MPKAVKEVVRSSSDTYLYRGRLAAGWVVYFAGWVIWIVSLWLPIDHLAQGAWTHPNAPLPTGLFVILTALMPILAFFDIHLYWPYLPLWLYYPGLFAALVCAFRPRPPILFVLLRICSLAILEVWVWELIYQIKDRRGTFYWGGTVLALGSTLICLGVWLIPPRRAKIDG